MCPWIPLKWEKNQHLTSFSVYTFQKEQFWKLAPCHVTKGATYRPSPLPTVIENTLSQVSTISPNEIRSGLPCFVGGTTKQQFWQEAKTKVFFFSVGYCKHSAKYAVLCDGKTDGWLWTQALVVSSLKRVESTTKHQRKREQSIFLTVGCEHIVRCAAFWGSMDFYVWKCSAWTPALKTHI